MKNEFQKRILSSVIIIPITLFLIIKGAFYFNLLLLICLVTTIYEWHLMSKGKYYNILGFILIIISFYFVYHLRNNASDKEILFLFVLLICVSTDIGGYLFGKIFQGPKLTSISPNKTYSGMIGGFLLSIFFACIYLNYYNYYVIEKAEIISFYDLLFVIILSFISQIGDLIISYFKRKSKKKNTGKIIPGHGGMLDRIDGMIFAFPSAYIILKIIN